MATGRVMTSSTMSQSSLGDVSTAVWPPLLVVATVTTLDSARSRSVMRSYSAATDADAGDTVRSTAVGIDRRGCDLRIGSGTCAWPQRRPGSPEPLQVPKVEAPERGVGQLKLGDLVAEACQLARRVQHLQGVRLLGGREGELVDRRQWRDREERRHRARRQARRHRADVVVHPQQCQLRHCSSIGGGWGGRAGEGGRAGGRASEGGRERGRERRPWRVRLRLP